MKTENKAFTMTPFMSEWLAGGQPPNQLPISAVCNSRCLFCSNHLNPFPVAGGFFRDIEDIKLQLCAMSANDDPIRMSDSLPGRISEGEALLHPRLFDILEMVRRKFFYNTLCFTTNATMLDSVFLKKLSAFRPIELTVSLHSMEPTFWARIFGQDIRRAETAISSLPLIRAHKMDLIGTIVPLPKICGWDHLEQTYAHFVSQGASSMIVYWPGHTKRTRPEVVADLECSLAEFTDFAERMKTAYRVPLIPHPDMVSPLRARVETIVAKTLKGNPKNGGGAYRKVVWLSSAAAFCRLEPLVKEKMASAPNIHQVEAVENATYGGNIMAAGLLMVEDFIRTGKKVLEQWPDADLFLVPRVPFDTLLRDLEGTPAYRIPEELARSVWLVDAHGGIDPLLSTRLVTRRGSAHAPPHEVMERFNRARFEDAELEAGLDLIASFPIETSRGPVDRASLREAIRAGRKLTEGAFPSAQHFEMLDADHALCVEAWLAKDSPGLINRWIRLIRQDSKWLIESISEGFVET
jgi:wyosine [tRNA(Phe)-imidazoG37] synthetase (radical SAM superfamily)